MGDVPLFLYALGMANSACLPYAFDHWNDYGYRTLYALTAKIEGEIYDFGSLKISFIPYQHEKEIDLQSILVQDEGYNLISLGDKEYYEFLNNFLHKYI